MFYSFYIKFNVTIKLTLSLPAIHCRNIFQNKWIVIVNHQGCNFSAFGRNSAIHSKACVWYFVRNRVFFWPRMIDNVCLMEKSLFLQNENWFKKIIVHRIVFECRFLHAWKILMPSALIWSVCNALPVSDISSYR